MPKSALEYFNEAHSYLNSDTYLGKDKETQDSELKKYNKVLNVLIKNETADMDGENLKNYMSQFDRPYDPSQHKQWAKTPSVWTDEEFVQNAYEIKHHPEWNDLSEDDQNNIMGWIGNEYRQRKLARGESIEPVEYDAKADAAQNTVKEWTGIEPQNQPQQVNDLSWKTGAKSVGKSLGRVPGSLVSTGMGAAGFGYDLLGSGLQVLPWQWTKDLGQLSKDTGAVLGTAANAVDTFNRNILPPEQKQSSSVGEWWNDRNAEQKALGILDEAPEQFFTFLLPMLTGHAAAKSAQLAQEGKLGGWLGKLLNRIRTSPKYSKWFKDSASGLEKGLVSANRFLSGIDPQKTQKVGTFVGSSAIEASEMAKNAYRNQGEIRSPLNMLGHALVAGKLESLVPEKLGGVFSPQTRAMLRRDFGKGAWKSSAHFLKNLGKDTLYNMVEEGLTELAQTYVEQSADMYNSKGLTADGIAPIHDINSAFETLKKDGINGLLKEAGRNERIADIFMATILGGITGGVGTASAHPVNYISYNSSPEGYLDRYRENRESLVNDLNNAKTDEERETIQKQLDEQNNSAQEWAESNPLNALRGDTTTILRSLEEMGDSNTSEDDLKDSFRTLSELSDSELFAWIDYLQRSGWKGNETFDRNLDRLIKYKEDIDFKLLPKEEQNRILDEREESERQARKAELDRIKAENEAKEKTEKLNLESKLANGLLQHAIQQNWTEQDAINKFLRGEQLTSSEEGIVNKVFEKYSGQTTDISQALNQELATLKNDEKNLWNQLNPNGSTQQTAQKPKQLQPVKLKNNNQAIAPQQTVQKNPQIQSIHNEINKLRQQKIKDEQEKEQLRQQLVEQQKTGSNANIQGKILQNGKRGFIGNEARLKAGDIDTKCNYAVVELSDLQTLTDEENPRQRNDRKAYANTVSERARNLDPDLLIDNSVGAQNGPIVVDQNLKVESGNGRTLSLREAYANRKGEGEYSNTETDAGYGKADIYRNKLIAEAPKYGISSEQVMQMKEPVLVRIRVADSNINAKDFWAKANNSQQESMSSTETALVDGEKVKPFLNQFEAIGDIRAKSNLKFVKSFLEKICSPYELNSMFTADGRSLSEAGEKRINNAIIASAYGNSEIVSLLTELGNEEIQTILNGLAMAAPDTAKLMGEVKSGAVHNVDFSKDLADAIRTIKNIRQNPDMNRLIKQFGSVSEVYLRQGLLGDDGLSPTARLFIGALGNLNNKETICNFLKSVNNTVRAEGNPNQLGMFEANTKPSDEVFVERAIRNMGLEYRNGKPIADDIERLKQGPVHVASNDDFHAEDAQGRRYSLGQTENTNTRTPEENYQLLMNQEPIDISINPLSNLVGKEQRTEAKNIYKRLLKIRVKTTDGKTVNFTNTGYKELKNHSANPLTLQIIPNLDELVRNAIYLYSEANHEQKRYNVDQYHYYTVKAQLINPETSKKEDYAVRIVLREDTNGNIFYDGDSTEITKIGKLREQSHRVPNTGNHVAPTNSLIKYFENVNFNKKKKLLDKAQSNHIGKTNTPSAISGGSFSNLSISDNDDLSSRRNSLSDSEDYRTEAERLADDGTTATREEFDNVIQNVNESLDPDAGISFEIYDSVEDFNKGRADNDKAPSDANAFTDKETGKIVFFRDKLTTLTRLKQVIAHELVGHEGIERLLGGRYYDVFLKSIRKLASRDGRVGKLLAQVQRTYGRFYSPESHQMYEELGAHLAELYARKPESFSDRVHNYIRKLKVMFRNALRNWGVDIEFNQVDLEDIFAKARESVETRNTNKSTNDSGRRYSRRRKADDKNQLKFFDYDREDNQDYSEEEDSEESLGNEFADLYDRLEKESSEFDDYEEDFVDDEEIEYPDEYYGKDSWKLIQSYQENGNVIYDILPRILEEDYESVSDPFSDYYNSEIPAPVQALLKITNNGELLGDLDYYLNNAEGNLPGSEAIDLLEHLKNHIKETYYKPFANKIIRNCDKAIDMIRNGEFKEGVIKPVSIEELERQDIKKMPEDSWEAKQRIMKEKGLVEDSTYWDYKNKTFYSLSSEAKQIKQKAIDNGTFLKAPNGKDSNLNEDQWIEARTKEFKDKFGDWELVNDVSAKNKPLSDKETVKIIEKWANQELVNDKTGIKAKISATQRNKLISKAAKRKSAVNGFSVNSHNQAVAIIDKLFKHASLLIEHSDRNNDPNIKSMKRFISPIVLDEGPAVAYLTVKESIEHGHRIYSLELTNIEKLEGSVSELVNKHRSASSFYDKKLVEFFEKIEKFDRSKLDENGEPKAEYLKSASNSSIVQKGKLSSKRSYSLGTDGQRLTNPESDNLEDLYNNLMNGSEENSQDNDFVKDINALGKSEDRRYALAGIRARTANIARLNEAQRMLADGEDKKTVWQKTGWYIAKDGKPRFEISDKDFKFKKRLFGLLMPKSGKLDSVVQHDKLFEAYPFLKDISIEFRKDKNDGNGGYYDRKNSQIVITNHGGEKQMEKTLIHEIQHAIQDYENFAKGTTINNSDIRSASKELLEEFKKEYLKDVDDDEIRKVFDDYIDLINIDFTSAAIKGEGRTEAEKILEEHIEDASGRLRKVLLEKKGFDRLAKKMFESYSKDKYFLDNAPETVAKAKENYKKNKRIQKEIKHECFKLEKRMREIGYKYLDFLSDSLSEKVYDKYKRHYGEGESRVVSKRLDYEDFERDEIMPEDDFDYNIDESIVDFGEHGRRYSLNQFLDSGKRFVDVQANQEEFDGLSDKQKINKAIKIIKDKFAQKVIGIDNRVFVNSSQAKEYGYPPKEINDKDIINAKMRASTELDNLVDAGTNFRTEEDGKDGHIHPDAKNFEYFDVLFKVGDQFYKGVINIKNNNRGRLFYDITKIENVTKDQTDSTGNIPAFGFLRDISMPDEKSSDKFSIAENSDNRNPAEDTDSNDSISKRVYSLGSTIEQQRKQFEDYVDGKMGIKLSDDEKDTIKAILETDDDADLDLNDIPTFGERLGNAKESLKTLLGQLITGLIGDTESRADRKKAPYLWQKDHSTENVVETPYEISRRTKIEQGMKTREEEDRLVLKHLDADKNLFTGLIRKWTKPGALQDWMLKKASRILAPFQIMKPVEQLLFTVAENIMWDEAKQQMVIAPYRDTEYDKQTNRPIGYKYDPNEKNGRLALDIYNNKLNDEFKAIIKERSIANNKFREDFVNRVVPFEQAKLYLARFGRKRLEGASKKIVDGNDRQAYSYITKLKGIIEDTEYNELISQYDQIKSIPDEQLGRNSAFINSIIGELAGNPAITTNGIDAKLNWLTTNKGLYGYAHHLVSIDPETGNGKPFNALGKISHPWIESIAGDRRGRKGDNSEYRSLLRADLERNRKEAEAEAANRWMEATENTYGITLEEAKNLEKLQKQGKGPGMPEGYEHRHKVIANFGKFRGKVIYLPDETFEAYQMIKDNRSLDSMKQFREFIQKMNNLNGRINEAMLWHPGKAMRDIMAGPFHLLEFLRDWSMKHPTEINDAAKAIWHGVKNSVSPEYWQSHSPESMGEYSESVIYQTQEGQSPTFGFIDSLFKYFQRAIPVGRTLEAMYKEINFAGGADIPLKRIFTTVGEELADKRGLTGQERERFIYDLVNDYAFDTGDLPEILGWLRGKKPDSKSQALGMISRATVPFMGYATRMIKQMITDPVTKGAIPLAKRAFGNVDSDSNLRSEISEISRPFFWLMLKALIAAGLGGILPPPTAEEIQDMPGVPPSARTHGRFYVGDSDKGERWMSTKGLGQLETAYIMDDYLKGKSDIIDFSQEFITVHPVMKLIANAAGMTSEYDREVPFTAQVGRTLGSLLVPEMTRFGPDIEKLIRSVFKLGISNRKKQNFLNGFLSQFGIPTGQVLVDREGHLRLSDTAIELLKLQGINIREIPFDTIEETTRAEASRIANDSKKIEKLRNYRSGKYAPKSEQEFLKQDFGGDFSSVAEAENYYSNLAERERKVVDTATKLHNKGHWTDLEDVAREKKELAAEKKKQQNEDKPTKRRRTTRRKKAERPLLNDDLNYINNDIRKSIYNSREEEYQELYDKLMQNNKKHNPRRGVAGQLERLLKEME